MGRVKRPVTMAPTIFPVYKPQGKTSSDIVYHFKKNLPQGFGKIGHLGTLDPFAQGLLLIAVAGAARAGDYLHEYAPKTYRARGVVGVKTASGDNTLEAIHQEDPPEVLDKTEIKDLESQLREKFLGEYWQNVPAFSATKHQGRPLYEYARKGEFIEKPKVKREIYDLCLIDKGQDFLELEVQVSTGTYIRTLFEDICESFGSCGHLNFLERTQIGTLAAENSLKEQDWPRRDCSFDIKTFGLSLPEALGFRRLFLSSDESLRYRNGQTLKIESNRLQADTSQQNIESCPYCWVFDHQEELCGLGSWNNSELKATFNLPKILA